MAYAITMSSSSNSSIRYHQNDLSPITITSDGLQCILTDLQKAITDAVVLIIQATIIADGDYKADSKPNSIYTGDTGIALMFLRLAIQCESAGLEGIIAQDTLIKIPTIIKNYVRHLTSQYPNSGRLSPLDSNIGPAIVYVFSSLALPDSFLPGPCDRTANRISGQDEWSKAVEMIKRAVSYAAADDSIGGDEVLYGRAGLLWAMLNLKTWLDSRDGRLSVERQDLDNIMGDNRLEVIFDEIIKAGDTSAELYKKASGESMMPLMWPWHGKYYLGAIHGTAGILSILLQAPRSLVTPHLPSFVACITALCSLTVKNHGHLPSSLPVRSRSHNLVQICHGSPGLLLLLAIFRTRFPQEWRKEWDTAEEFANEALWKEGLVLKGLGICHGVAGNAWPWLLQSRVRRGTPEGNLALSRALSFLLHAKELPPLVSSGRIAYRTPDHPYSLFEGLAGSVCAWTEACTIIREQLANMKDSPNKKELILGIPGLGGAGPQGCL